MSMLLPTVLAKHGGRRTGPGTAGRSAPSVPSAGLDRLEMDAAERQGLMERLARDDANPLQSVIEVGAGSLHLITDPLGLFQLHETIAVIKEILGVFQFSTVIAEPREVGGIVGTGPTGMGNREEPGQGPSGGSSKGADAGARSGGARSRGTGSDEGMLW